MEQKTRSPAAPWTESGSGGTNTGINKYNRGEIFLCHISVSIPRYALYENAVNCRTSSPLILQKKEEPDLEFLPGMGVWPDATNGFHEEIP